METINKTLFVYKREVGVAGVKEDTENGIVGADPYTKIVHDSFDTERVIRTITMDDGSVLVLLDDMHERYETKPKVHPKTGAPVFNRKQEMIYERVKDMYQSEIKLTAEDGAHFLELTAMNSYE